MACSPASRKEFHGKNKMGMELHDVGMSRGFLISKSIPPSRTQVIPSLFPSSSKCRCLRVGKKPDHDPSA